MKKSHKLIMINISGMGPEKSFPSMINRSYLLHVYPWHKQCIKRKCVSINIRDC